MNQEKQKILVFGNGHNGQARESLLRTEKYEVDHHSSVPEALSALIEEDFDLVMLQAQENEYEAFKVCRIIKSYGGLQFLPVIYIESAFNKDHLIRAYDAGADEYIEYSDCDDQDKLKDAVSMYVLIGKRKRLALASGREKPTYIQQISREIYGLKKELSTK